MAVKELQIVNANPLLTGQDPVGCGEYIGDYTRKAMELFSFSSFRFQRSMVKAMGMVKYAVATEPGIITRELGR
ncbi:MAG: hypothetical protein RXN78_03825 [Vulcanisaeta sp.]